MPRFAPLTGDLWFYGHHHTCPAGQANPLVARTAWRAAQEIERETDEAYAELNAILGDETTAEILGALDDRAPQPAAHGAATYAVRWFHDGGEVVRPMQATTERDARIEYAEWLREVRAMMAAHHPAAAGLVGKHLTVLVRYRDGEPDQALHRSAFVYNDG